MLSVDEKTQIQALERTQLMLPLRPGKVPRFTHDYERHGVLDLYAALNVVTGEVSHQCTDRHTAKEFLGFLRLLARQYRGKELHVILDNSSAHLTPAVQRWLECHPKVHFHYTPTSASWLNQVEAIFSILTRQLLRHGDFQTRTALRKHIEGLEPEPHPFIWTKAPPPHPRSSAHACPYLVCGTLASRLCPRGGHARRRASGRRAPTATADVRRAPAQCRDPVPSPGPARQFSERRLHDVLLAKRWVSGGP